MTTSSPYPPAEVVIGLDVGTTGTKTVAFGMGSPWRHTVVREYPLLAPGPGWQVQDPATVVAAVMGALAEVVTAGREALRLTRDGDGSLDALDRADVSTLTAEDIAEATRAEDTEGAAVAAGPPRWRRWLG